MNIALNLLQLPPGRPEGVATYVRQLVAEFNQMDTTDRFFIFIQPGLDLPTLRPNGPVKVIAIHPPSRAFAIRALRKLGKKIGIVGSNTVFELLHSHHIDLIHYPFSVIPAPDRHLKIPIVLSVMDLQHEYYPQLFTPADLADRKGSFGPSAKKARHIIAISDFTKRSLTEKLDCDPDKISVIYLDGHLSPNPDTSLSLPKNFMYYPAADWPHKNHANLFKAMRLLAARGLTPSLVLTGVTSDHQNLLQKQVITLGLDTQIVHLGKVTYDQVAGVYLRAKMLIYPSLFEGFGIPVLEAMCSGVPVACSNSTSVPEVAGKAAELFDPTDVDAIASAIERVWNDPSYATRLQVAGREQSQHFSWSRCALETIQVYKKVLSDEI